MSKEVYEVTKSNIGSETGIIYFYTNNIQSPYRELRERMA
jgi:hypothetical protein